MRCAAKPRRKPSTVLMRIISRRRRDSAPSSPPTTTRSVLILLRRLSRTAVSRCTAHIGTCPGRPPRAIRTVGRALPDSLQHNRFAYPLHSSIPAFSATPIMADTSLCLVPHLCHSPSPLPSPAFSSSFFFVFSSCAGAFRRRTSSPSRLYTL